MSTVLATPPSDLVPTGAVAAAFGVSRKTVLYWHKTGRVYGEYISPRLLLVSMSDAQKAELRTRNSRIKRKRTLSQSA